MVHSSGGSTRHLTFYSPQVQLSTMLTRSDTLQLLHCSSMQGFEWVFIERNDTTLLGFLSLSLSPPLSLSHSLYVSVCVSLSIPGPICLFLCVCRSTQTYYSKIKKILSQYTYIANNNRNKSTRYNHRFKSSINVVSTEIRDPIQLRAKRLTILKFKRQLSEHYKSTYIYTFAVAKHLHSYEVYDD